MKKAIIIAAIAFGTACASSGGQEQARFDDACAAIMQERGEGEVDVVMRDQSTKTRIAAVGVTADGGLKEAAGFVGPSIITSRGGALAHEGGSTDIEMQACPE